MGEDGRLRLGARKGRGHILMHESSMNVNDRVTQLQLLLDNMKRLRQRDCLKFRNVTRHNIHLKRQIYNITHNNKGMKDTSICGITEEMIDVETLSTIDNSTCDKSVSNDCSNKAQFHIEFEEPDTLFSPIDELALHNVHRDKLCGSKLKGLNLLALASDIHRTKCNIMLHNRQPPAEKLRIVNQCGRMKAKKWFTCQYCNMECDSRSLLRVHTRKHTGERPYKCHICYKAFTQRGNLSLHMNIHSKEKSYCEDCGKQFAHKRSLHTHRKTCRVGIPKYKDHTKFPCRICHATLHAGEHASLHMKGHRLDVIESGGLQVSPDVREKASGVSNAPKALLLATGMPMTRFVPPQRLTHIKKEIGANVTIKDSPQDRDVIIKLLEYKDPKFNRKVFTIEKRDARTNQIIT